MKRITQKKYVFIFIHLFIWLVLFAMPRFFFHAPLQNIHPLKQTVLWATLIISFYLNYYLLIPKFLTKKRFLLYGIIVFNLLLFSFLSSVITDSIISPKSGNKPVIIEFDAGGNKDKQNVPPQPQSEDLKRIENNRIYLQAINSMLFVFVVLAVGTSIRITDEWYRDEKKHKEMETQKLSAELSLLKSQINPHFFFNTLNSIYSLANRKSSKTPEAIIKLSNLMRYIIYDSDKELVPLQNELDYIRNYVELQRLRLQENVSVLFDVKGEIFNKQIEPLLLLPFIENAFKHGIDYTKSCTISIIVRAEKNKLFFTVENPIVPNQNISKNDPSGLGLSNSRKRLLLLYNEKHNLNIHKDPNVFRVELTLDFKKQNTDI